MTILSALIIAAVMALLFLCGLRAEVRHPRVALVAYSASFACAIGLLALEAIVQ